MSEPKRAAIRRSLVGPERDEVTERVSMYGIDGDVRALARALGPVAAKHAHAVVGAYFERTLAGNPELATAMGRSREAVIRDEVTHIDRLLEAEFDDAYFNSLNVISATPVAAKLGSRTRVAVAQRLMPPLFAAIAERHRFSPKAIGRECASVARLFFLDLTAAIVVDQHAARREVDQRGQELDRLASGFREEVATMSSALQSQAGLLREAAGDTLRRSAATKDQAIQAEQASLESAHGIAGTAAAAEEMSASVSDIAEQSERSLRVAGRAVADTNEVRQAVTSLAEAAVRIGSVTALIEEIAAQTNLLALNATIEAARAGDAGRGFAVVASEVKGLAAQTVRAIAEISQQIGQVQAAASACVERTSRIAATIADIEGAAGAIATAVNQQACATAEIARGSADAAQRTQEVSGVAQAVRASMDDMMRSSQQVLSAADGVTERAATLEGGLNAFLAGVQAA